MVCFTLRTDDDRIIQVYCEDTLNYVIKLKTSVRNVYLLSDRNELFYGARDSNKESIQLFRVSEEIIDIDCFRDILYIVTESNCVYQTNESDLAKDSWSEIIVPNPRTCPHGVKLLNDKVQIGKINCNGDGILFTTIDSELYAVGNFGEVLQSDVPVRVECFNGFKILQIATGENFAVVLTNKNSCQDLDNHGDDDQASESSDKIMDVVMNTDCPKCVPGKVERIVSKSTTESSLTSSATHSELCDNGQQLNEGNTDIVPIKDKGLNFLLESLSLSGEDYLHQTRIIKDNVTNITAKVYEGVKLLSRHMSGSSENNDTVIENTDLQDRSTRKGEWPEYSADDSSLDAGSGTDLHSSYRLENRIAKLSRIGNILLGTGIWCFGSVNRGHLASGDHIKRTRIVPVIGLNGQGVINVRAGGEHAAALTLDGRLYLWGNNENNQISSEKFDDLSIPHRFRSTENILSVACGHNQSYAISNNLSLFVMVKNAFTKEIITNTTAESNHVCPLILASDSLLLQNHSNFSIISKYLNNEQNLLQSLLEMNTDIVRPFIKKIYSINHSQAYDQLFLHFTTIINLVALNIRSVLDYYQLRINCLEIVMINNCIEMCTALKHYLRVFCDITCINGFNTINLLSGRPNRGSREVLRALDTKKSFYRPFDRLHSYVGLIEELLAIETNESTKLVLEDRKCSWEKLINEKNIAIEASEKTIEFWNTIGKNLVTTFQMPERRILLDSRNISLKTVNSGRFSSNWFILFSDMLCYHSGTVQIYPLRTLWIESIADSDVRKNSLKLISPEETLIVITKTHEDKLQWLESIENSIRICLGKSSTAKVPQYRNASYTFSDKHPKYPGAKYFGRWFSGQMQGVGHLEFADGKVYNGQMWKGQMQGFGRMFTPNLGIYEGNFESGKFHGFGVLEMKNKGCYEGNFKDGQYFGHGIMRCDSYTYIGEFRNNVKTGYGVLDETNSGDKYMGMFVDNKKNGFGICITMDGNYFTGLFVNDSLYGDGMAILANGSYYEGDLTMIGPNGKGSFYVPLEEEPGEEYEIENNVPLMRGNILSGGLSGFWSDIKIHNGTLSTNKEFLKFPKSFETYAIEFNRRWAALFSDWELDVFGGTNLENNKQVWNKIVVHITNAKRKEQFKSEGFMTTKPDESLTRCTESDIESEVCGKEISKWSSLDRISVRSSTSHSSHGSRKNLSGSNEGINSSSSSNRLHENLRQEVNLLEIFKTNHKSNDTNLRSMNYSIGEEASEIKSSLSFSLEYIPNFGINTLTKQELISVKEYLSNAFRDINHPLGLLSTKISHCFYLSYGCWKMKPISILSYQAMKEWESITHRIYLVIRRMFPALPLEAATIDK